MLASDMALLDLIATLIFFSVTGAYLLARVVASGRLRLAQRRAVRESVESACAAAARGDAAMCPAQPQERHRDGRRPR
jgi:hypothetical protein